MTSGGQTLLISAILIMVFSAGNLLLTRKYKSTAVEDFECGTSILRKYFS
jgi:NADH:ubiquinone oxidoreductase subunit 3 (subunit A)